MNLTDITSPADIRSMKIGELQVLADEMRAALLQRLAACGGHAGPNLGFLEATIALHYVFDTPRDKVVFDVSHQTYVHKMLTGRMRAFVNPQDYKTVSGFTNPAESMYDLFEIGHTSTAVSLASGLALSRDLKGGSENIVAVIGDGSLSGGQAFEGLDYAAELNSNFIVIVNDNQMSIAPNHGGLYDNLRLLRDTNGTADDNYFKSLGYDYLYVPYGNDLEALVQAFRSVKGSQRPVVVHINTMKGEGYAPAEREKEKFHYTAPFDIETGATAAAPDGYTDIFAEHMLDRIDTDKRVVVITAGTPGAIGFGPGRRDRAGRNFVDVGIAEEQAVSMSAGLAKGGMRPVFGVCASFLQRAYDQLSQDVSINAQPAVIVTFYGGVRGMRDVTHLGFFDVPMISNIPGILFLEATCREEYTAMLDWAVDKARGPVVVRTPSGDIVSRRGDYDVDYARAPYEIVEAGSQAAIIAAGDFLPMAMDAARILKDKGLCPTVINPRCVSRLDTDTLDTFRDYSVVVTLEDNSIDGGFGQKVAAYLGDAPVKVICRGLPTAFADRYSPDTLLDEAGLTPAKIAAEILQNCPGK